MLFEFLFVQFDRVNSRTSKRFHEFLERCGVSKPLVFQQEISFKKKGKISKKKKREKKLTSQTELFSKQT